MKMHLCWALATSASLASAAGAETSPVTVSQLEGRPLEEVARALGPLIVGSMKLMSFSYGPPRTPGEGTAVFDHRSYYVENGVCAKELWEFSFKPRAGSGTDRSLNSQREPRNPVEAERDRPLELSKIAPAYQYWMAAHDVETEFPLTSDLSSGEIHDIARKRAAMSRNLCREAPRDAHFFGAGSPGNAAWGVGLFRRIVARINSNSDSLTFKCSYTAAQCAELKSHVRLEELSNIKECDFRFPQKSCLDFTMGLGGTIQGTYVRMAVSFGHSKPDNYDITLYSMSFAS